MAAPGHELPEGWTEHTLGLKTFYFHQASNTTQEERPSLPPAALDASPSASQALRAAPAPSAPLEASVAQAHVVATPVMAAAPAAPPAPPAPAAAPPAAPTAVVQVVVPPPGLQPGQQLAFSTPAAEGQPARPLTVTAEQAVAAGSVLTVQCPTPQPPAQAASNLPAPPTIPQPEVAMAQEDAVSAARGWILFVSGWACLILGWGFLGPMLWLVAASLYFCRRREIRAQRVGQRKAAVASCCALTLLALAGCLMVAGTMDDLPAHHGGHHHGRHHGRPHHHHHHPNHTNDTNHTTLMPTDFDYYSYYHADEVYGDHHYGHHHGHHVHGHNHTGEHNHSHNHNHSHKGCHKGEGNHTGEHHHGHHHMHDDGEMFYYSYYHADEGHGDHHHGHHHGHHEHGHNHTGEHNHSHNHNHSHKGCHKGEGNHTGEHHHGHHHGHHHQDDDNREHGSLFHLRGHWHHQGAEEKPCAFRAFLRRVFGGQESGSAAEDDEAEKDGDTLKDVPAGPLPVFKEGQTPLRQIM